MVNSVHAEATPLTVTSSNPPGHRHQIAKVVKDGAASTATSSASSGEYIFDTRTCRETMAREFITLLGFISTVPIGRKFLEPILTDKDGEPEPSLVRLGECPQCDFLSRLMLMGLDVTDPSWQVSRRLMERWLSNGKASVSLRLCANDVLRTLLRSRSLAGSETWAVAMLMLQVVVGGWGRERVKCRVTVHCCAAAPSLSAGRPSPAPPLPLASPPPPPASPAATSFSPPPPSPPPPLPRSPPPPPPEPRGPFLSPPPPPSPPPPLPRSPTLSWARVSLPSWGPHSRSWWTTPTPPASCPSSSISSQRASSSRRTHSS